MENFGHHINIMVYYKSGPWSWYEFDYYSTLSYSELEKLDSYHLELLVMRISSAVV